MTRLSGQENDSSQYWDLVQRIERLERGLPTDIIYVGITVGAPAFQNSWVNFDGNTPPTHRSAFFYKDRGRVYMGGVIKTGASATTAFVLPVGYRPIFQTNQAHVFPVAASAGIANLAVLVNGSVQPTNVGSSAVATFCFLDGVSFLAA